MASLLDTLKNFWKSSDEVKGSSTTSKKERRPISVDMTESYVANKALTKGLYHNTYPGLKLSGSLAYPMISLPVYFMGMPTPTHDDPKIQEILTKFAQDLKTEIQSIHIQSHREGTIWIWPKFDRYSGKLVWEFISDDSVVDIIKDISSGRIIEIWTDEQISVKTKYNETKTFRRIRNFTDSQINVKYVGAEGISDKIKDFSARNPAGVMPIPFANNSDGDEVRGHSDYERLLPDFASYHEISKSEQEILAKYKPKMIFEVMDVDEWLKNNGYDSINDINIASIDYVFSIKDKEKVSFQAMTGATDGHNRALERIFIKFVESSGLPEIIWGPSVTGNHATSAESMATLIKFVQDKMRQKDEPYTQLWNSTLRLYLQANFSAVPPDMVKNSWNDLDSLSEISKVDVFQKFAAGVAQLVSGAGATIEQIHMLWMAQFPKYTETDIEKFKLQLNEMAVFKQFAQASYAEQLSLGGNDTQGAIDRQNSAK